MSKRFLLFTLLILFSVAKAWASPSAPPEIKNLLKAVKTSTADHSKFESLQEEFDYAPDVTEACLECHTEAASQIHDTIHWNWGTKVNDKFLGKAKNSFNNYCVSARENASCSQCHVGYGLRNDNFDFESEENIDCLVCHDTTGTYKKSGTAAGHPYYEDTKVGDKIEPAVDLAFVAQSVGDPGRENCLACHANGGGGNATKHGDTDMSLVDPVHELDVHMSSDKLNFTCQTCHKTSGHEIAGRQYDKKAWIDHELDMGRSDRDGNNVSCESCHSSAPHEERKLNNHTAKVACTSCHIPEMARGPYATKLSWDWSTATRMKDGKPYTEVQVFDGVEKHSYSSKKGTFTWGRHVTPEYRWYKGELAQMSFEDTFDPSTAPIDINPPSGDYNDEDARIWPFKIHRGKQPYDTDRNRMAPIKLFGKKGTGALWTEFDWDKALKAGAEIYDFDYDGNYDFIETNGYWPIKHMVAPSQDAVECRECHSVDGRLAGLNDFYLVGRDRNVWVEAFGALAIFGGLAGVAGHGGLRYLMARRRVKKQAQQVK